MVDKETFIRAGQAWHYKNGFDEDSYILILKVDEFKNKRIIHLTVISESNNIDVPLHMPFASSVVQQMITSLKSENNRLPDFSKGYDIWKTAYDKGEAGVYNIPISDVLNLQ